MQDTPVDPEPCGSIAQWPDLADANREDADLDGTDLTAVHYLRNTTGNPS